MKIGFIAIVACFLFAGFASCKKNSTSKVPQISFMQLTPDTTQQGSAFDTVSILFNLTDAASNLSSGYIYYQDSRFDTGFIQDILPSVSISGLNPAQSISGTCTYYMLSANILVRPDSIHQKLGDTLHYEIYITDNAGNASNHITTSNLYIRP
jgi:hypothetical protein